MDYGHVSEHASMGMCRQASMPVWACAGRPALGWGRKIGGPTGTYVAGGGSLGVGFAVVVSLGVTRMIPLSVVGAVLEFGIAAAAQVT
jgi:hypothetical protein